MCHQRIDPGADELVSVSIEGYETRHAVRLVRRARSVEVFRRSTRRADPDAVSEDERLLEIPVPQGEPIRVEEPALRVPQE